MVCPYVRLIRGAKIESDHYLVRYIAKVNVAKQLPKKNAGKRKQLRSKRLQTMEGRLKFQARLRAKCSGVEQKEGEDVERMHAEFTCEL